MYSHCSSLIKQQCREDIAPPTKTNRLLFFLLQTLHVNSSHAFFPLFHRRFRVSLTAPQFPDNTGLFKLLFEPLQCPFDAFSFFQWNYNHKLLPLIFLFSFYYRKKIRRKSRGILFLAKLSGFFPQKRKST